MARTLHYNGVCSSPTSRDKRANVREWWWALRMEDILNAQKKQHKMHGTNTALQWCVFAPHKKRQTRKRSGMVVSTPNGRHPQRAKKQHKMHGTNTALQWGVFAPTRRDKRANVREQWWALRMGEILNAQNAAHNGRDPQRANAAHNGRDPQRSKTQHKMQGTNTALQWGMFAPHKKRQTRKRSGMVVGTPNGRDPQRAKTQHKIKHTNTIL